MRGAVWLSAKLYPALKYGPRCRRQRELGRMRDRNGCIQPAVICRFMGVSTHLLAAVLDDPRNAGRYEITPHGIRATRWQ